MADLEIKNESVSSAGNMTLFLCNFCNECYSQERSFKLHYRAHKSFTCDTCGKVFSLKRDLTVHLRCHDTIKKVYACEHCDKVFNYKPRLKMHERIHNPEKSHICDVCKSTFNSQVALKKHYTTHAAEEPYVCDICQACFSEKSSLQAHKFTHITEKNNNSDEVNDSKEDKVVKNSGEHPQRIHKGSAQHKCDICQKFFKTKTLLKNHYVTHKEEKSHVGNISERPFSEFLTGNKRTTEKLHVCDLCEKAFSRKSSLMSHGCTKKREA